MKIKNLSGKRFSHFVVMRHVGWTKGWNAKWECHCDCGTVKIVAGGDLTSGTTVSCGCYRRRRRPDIAKRFLRHGHGRNGKATRVYNAWRSMRRRCKSSEYYTERGIKVCKRWHTFENFLTDMGEPPKGLTLERKNNNGNYTPSNCIWATQKQQLENRCPQSEWRAPPGPRR